MAIYWLLSGRVRFEHSLSWGLVGNALYLVFFYAYPAGQAQKTPNVMVSQICPRAQNSSFKATTPHSWDSALLPCASPSSNLRFGLAVAPSQTRSSLRTKAKSCSSWHPVERLRGSVFQTAKGLNKQLLKTKCTDRQAQGFLLLPRLLRPHHSARCFP